MNFYSVISSIQKDKGQVPLEVRVGGWVSLFGEGAPRNPFFSRVLALLPRLRLLRRLVGTQASGWVGGSLGVAQFFGYKINNEPKFFF